MQPSFRATPDQLRQVEGDLQQLCRSTVEVSPQGQLAEHLAWSRQAGRPLSIKLGCDPTADDLHLGHTVVLDKLAQFQALGHQVIFVVGDVTAQIGDPTGRNLMRPPLSAAAVQAHAQTYLAQVVRVLDPAPQLLQVRHNSEWLSRMQLPELMALAASYNLGRMLERRDFRQRLSAGRQLAMHELFYPLLQGQDSVVLQPNVEVGGEDQIFNLNVGRHLMEARGLRPQVVMTLPLLVGTCGVDKMSKSLGNQVGIGEPARQMFAKVMRISDATLAAWWDLMWSGPPPAIPPDTAAELWRKKQLAGQLVARFHGPSAASDVRAWWDAGRPLDEAAAATSLPAHTSLQQAVLAVGGAASGAQARRKIEQGGVCLDGLRVDQPRQPLPPGRHLLTVGRALKARIEVAAPTQVPPS